MIRNVSKNHKGSCEPRNEKTSNVDSEQVRHKPSCISREDGQMLEVLNFKSRGIVLSVATKALISFAVNAKLMHICKNCWFSYGLTHII